jgi:prepilin-type processing-associated H-X9-DG protein
MKIPRSNQATTALTLTEVILCIGVLALVLLVILPMLPHSHRSPRISCVNNLKQIGLSFRIFANDNNEKFPMQLGSIQPANLIQIVGSITNYLGDPRRTICPADSREPAKSWETLLLSNLSYYMGLDAKASLPQMILSGDRDLAENGQLLRGTAHLTTNRPVAWHKLLHKEGGNIALADGSVQQTTTATLRSLLANTGDATNRVLFPQ